MSFRYFSLSFLFSILLFFFFFFHKEEFKYRDRSLEIGESLRF